MEIGFLVIAILLFFFVHLAILIDLSSKVFMRYAVHGIRRLGIEIASMLRVIHLALTDVFGGGGCFLFNCYHAAWILSMSGCLLLLQLLYLDFNLFESPIDQRERFGWLSVWIRFDKFVVLFWAFDEIIVGLLLAGFDLLD